MSAERFKIVATNPNDTAGGGGCLCSESYQDDQHGPFAVFYQTEMESVQSPHPVLCLGCAESMIRQAVESEPLAGGEQINQPYEQTEPIENDTSLAEEYHSPDFEDAPEI